MPDDPQARYRREASQQLLMGEAWKLLLGYILERLTLLDRLLHPPLERVATTDDRTRLAASGGYSELTALVKQVTTWADAPNPFDVHREALWSSVAPRQMPEPEGGDLPELDAEAARIGILMKKRPPGEKPQGYASQILSPEEQAALAQHRRRRGGGVL